MFGLSGKSLWVVAGCGVLVLFLAVRLFFGGSPDVSGEDPEQRIASIEKLTIRAPSDAGEKLARVADTDPSPKVRRVALASLSHFLEPAHRPVVMKSIKDPDPRIREVAVDTLGIYADKAATVELAQIVKKEPEENVRKAALRGLVRCENPESIVALLDRAEHGKTLEIKRVAMKGLLRKLGVRMSRLRDPKDARDWRDLIQRWKESRRVVKAYKDAGVRLVRRPQDRKGKDWHPERRRRAKGQ